MSIEKRAYHKGLRSFLLGGAVALWVFAGCATVETTGPSQETAGPASIQAINVHSGEGEKTAIEIVNSTSAPYAAFQLIDPPRVVLDIRGVPGSDIPSTMEVNDGTVSRIRLQKGRTQSDTTRVVIGMARPGNYDIVEKDNTILLTLTPKISTVAAAEGKKAAQGDDVLKPNEPRIFFKPVNGKLNQVLGVDFTMMEGGKSRLTVTTDRKVPYNLERRGPKTLALVLDETRIPPLLLRRLDSSRFKGAVERVKPEFSAPDKRLSLAITLREMVPLHVDQTDRDIHIDFGPTAVRPPVEKIVPVKLAAAREPSVAVQPAAVTPAPKKPVGGPIPGLHTGRYRGPNMTMDFSNAEVTNVLRLIGEVSNLNVIWGPDVKGKVSMRLKNVPWEQALELILENNGLGKREEGNIIWITTKAKIRQIEKEEARKRAARKAEERRLAEEMKQKAKEAKALQPLVKEYLRVDFADATGDILPHLEKIKTERGSLSVDKRTNTIIMTDIPSAIKDAKDIVREFDTPVKQIMIEARIVEATTNLVRDLGVQWTNGGIGFQRRNNTGVAFNNFDATTFSTGGDIIAGGSFETNAPSGWQPNIGLNFGKLTHGALGALTLNAALALAETEGKGKILSAPKVIAGNGEEATISRGSTFYLPAADSVEAKEVTAKLELRVTPTVSYNNFVTMEITLKDEKQNGTSSKFGKDLSTKLMVQSGDTIVIGGIYREVKQDDEAGVPWLRDVPVLGWLFGATNKTFEKSELLIFLTPTVLPPPGSAL